MVRHCLEALWHIFGYILSIELYEIPLHIAYVGVCFLIAYVIESILIGLPVMIFEAVAKKQIPFNTKEKIAFRLTIVLGIALMFQLLYQKAA